MYGRSLISSEGVCLVTKAMIFNVTTCFEGLNVNRVLFVFKLLFLFFFQTGSVCHFLKMALCQNGV